MFMHVWFLLELPFRFDRFLPLYLHLVLFVFNCCSRLDSNIHSELAVFRVIRLIYRFQSLCSAAATRTRALRIPRSSTHSWRQSDNLWRQRPMRTVDDAWRVTSAMEGGTLLVEFAQAEIERVLPIARLIVRLNWHSLVQQSYFTANCTGACNNGFVFLGCTGKSR